MRWAAMQRFAAQAAAAQGMGMPGMGMPGGPGMGSGMSQRFGGGSGGQGNFNNQGGDDEASGRGIYWKTRVCNK